MLNYINVSNYLFWHEDTDQEQEWNRSIYLYILQQLDMLASLVKSLPMLSPTTYKITFLSPTLHR